MSASNLQVLQTHRDALLLAEVAAWLHDIGKLCDTHIKHKSEQPQPQWHDDSYKAIVDDPSTVIRLSRAAANLKKPNLINFLVGRAKSSLTAAKFIPQETKRTLAQTRINVLNEEYTLAELIMLGMPEFASSQNRSQLLDGKAGWLAALLGVCHSEAHVDKEEPKSNVGVQKSPNVFSSSAFGYEYQNFILGDQQISLDARLAALKLPNKNQLVLPLTRTLIARLMEYGLGDTRRPINEVSLADWSGMVAALFKSALAGAVLENKRPEIRGWDQNKKGIDHDLHWRILRINIDCLGLYAKAIKISDLLGYQDVIEKAYEEIKRLVEDEYPLGNEIYRDTTGIYFTFPNIDLPADLAQEIRQCIQNIEMELMPRIAVTIGKNGTVRDELRTILANARYEAIQELTYPFDFHLLIPYWQEQWNGVENKNREVCPVCRLRPKREDKEVCVTCEQRRLSRLGVWETNPQQTIWIDEIADHNGRVALIVGKFGLEDWLSGEMIQTLLLRVEKNNSNGCISKNPSPARIRRVWKSCLQFWSETVEKEIPATQNFGEQGDQPTRRLVRWLIVPDRKTGWRPKVPYDGQINGKPISLLWQESDRCFITISNLQWVDRINSGQTVTVKDPDKPDQILSFAIENAAPARDEKGNYLPFLPLLRSPDMFLALVPAVEALDITMKIHEKYRTYFGKVQNRLPLFLGMVFFPRKTPLMAVMDTARRMLNQVSLDKETWTISSVQDGHITFKNGITWTVPTQMGDGSPDVWYPYWQVEGKPTDRTHWFIGPQGEHWVHVSDLRPGDRVRVTPSRLAYLFLETTAQRFHFDPSRDVLLLDDLDAITKIWSNLKQSGISDTALQGLWHLLQIKAESWGIASPEFGHLTETVLKDAGLYRRKGTDDKPGTDWLTPAEVTSQKFFRSLELHLRILKLRLKEPQHEREPIEQAL
jgi:hypothetical protein